jgi:hypothetical protein
MGEGFRPRPLPQVREAVRVHSLTSYSFVLQLQQRENLSSSPVFLWGRARRCNGRPLSLFCAPCIADPCPQLWGDPAHLEKRCGQKPVAVHVTQVQQMDFVSKNFIYRTLPFGEAVKRCSSSHHDDCFVSPSEMSVVLGWLDDFCC